MRTRFNDELQELRNAILSMGSQVGEELGMAVQAYRDLDVHAAERVMAYDRRVNEQRFKIEDDCVGLIVMQQPAARDLRAILSALHMTIDLERMGDQAKGIAKVIPYLVKHPNQPRPPQLFEMASLVASMLEMAMKAYAEDDVALAQTIGPIDDRVDDLYQEVFRFAMDRLSTTDGLTQVEAVYELLRLARELERFGDLATNLAERVVYLVTGTLDEVNLDNDEELAA
jgi:phosphate transport system protein